MPPTQIRIGVLATLHGTYAAGGRDGIRGVHLALKEVDYQVAGIPIELVEEGTTGMPDDAYYTAQRLIEGESVDIIVGPLSGNEGLAIRNYALDAPEHTFFNGSSGAQNLTYPLSTPNFFNFAPNGVQAMAGVAQYAYDTLNYRRVITLGEDYSYPHAQTGAFVLEFCQAGGKIPQRHWVPLGESDFGSFIEAIPDDVDAVFVALGGTDAHSFLEQYTEAKVGKPLIGASIFIDDFILNATGAMRDVAEGTLSGSLYAVNNPDEQWSTFVERYREQFPDGQGAPGYFSTTYYTSTKAAILALQAVGGDLSDGQKSFQEAARGLKFQGPTGEVVLDDHQQVIGNTFITMLVRQEDDSLDNKLVKVNSNVDQFLGIGEEAFGAFGVFNSEVPACD